MMLWRVLEDLQKWQNSYNSDLRQCRFPCNRFLSVIGGGTAASINGVMDAISDVSKTATEELPEQRILLKK